MSMFKSRRDLVDYAVALDLVVIATGVALLIARTDAGWAAVLYQLLVPFAAWKGGWRGGIAAAIASTIVLVAFLGAGDVVQGIAFVVGSAIVCAVVQSEMLRSSLGHFTGVITGEKRAHAMIVRPSSS